jgi:hypothetical protein
MVLLKLLSPAPRFAVASAMALCSVGAQASFNSWGSGPQCRTVECALGLGFLLGFVAVPVSLAIFWGLYLIFRPPKREKEPRGWWILVNGCIAYAIAIVPLLLGPQGDPTGLYVYLGYAVVATCYLRWFPVRPVTNRGQAGGP